MIEGNRGLNVYCHAIFLVLTHEMQEKPTSSVLEQGLGNVCLTGNLRLSGFYI